MEIIGNRFSLPLLDFKLQFNIVDSIAHVEYIQTYRNHTDYTIESIFQLPCEKDIVLSKMSITVGDRTIETDIKSK